MRGDFGKVRETGSRNEITGAKATIPFFIIFHEFMSLDPRWEKVQYSHGLSISPSPTGRISPSYTGQQGQTVVETVSILPLPAVAEHSFNPPYGERPNEDMNDADLGLCCEGQSYRAWQELQKTTKPRAGKKMRPLRREERKPARNL